MNDPSKILADLARHRAALDLTGGLGKKLLDAQLAGQLDRFDRQVDPTGERWPELSEDYEKAKARKYPGQPIGVREGLMRSDSEMEGEPEITPTSAKRTYGKTRAARDEAEWFQEGDPTQNRPPRPFVGLSSDDEAKADQIIQEHLRESLS